jgi:hypothetical protein
MVRLGGIDKRPQPAAPRTLSDRDPTAALVHQSPPHE